MSEAPLQAKILVLGATGYTAKLLIPLLQANFNHVDLYSRAEDGDLKDFFHSPKFVESEVIINCIGPYNLTGEQIVHESVKLGKKYIDITGELFFVKSMFDKYSNLARDSKALIVHSCAFESFFADYLVNLLATPEEEIISLNSYYYFNQTKASPGTRATAKIHSFFPRQKIADTCWVEHDETGGVELVSFKDEYCRHFAPYPEIYFFNKRFKVRNIASFLLVPTFQIGLLGSAPANLSDNAQLEKTIKKLHKSNYQGPLEDERVNQEFELYIEKETLSGMKRIKLSGKDMYLRTAEAVSLLLPILLRSEKIGVFSPYELTEEMSIFHKICRDSNLVVENV